MIAIVEPLAKLGVADSAGLEPIAEQARARLQRALAQVRDIAE